MRINRISAGCGLLLASFGLATPASAGSVAAVPMTMTPIYMGTANVLGMIDAARNSMPKDDQPDTSRTASRPAPSVGSTNFAVAHDPAVSAQARKAFLADIVRSSGQTVADQVDQQFGDIQTTFSRAVTPYGLRTDDFADVMTAYMVMIWLAANRQVELPQAAQVQGVKQQLHAALSGKLGDPRQRQLLAETMMYQTCIMIVVREQAEKQRKPELMDTLAASIDRGSGQGGQLRQMALTTQGLVRR